MESKLETLLRSRKKYPWEDKVVCCITTLLYLFLLYKTCTNLVYGAEFVPQTFRDCYFFRGVAWFLVFIIVVRRVSFLNVPILATIAIYVVSAVKYFHAAAYQEELYNAMSARYMAWGLMLIIAVDFFRNGKRTSLNKINRVFPVLLMIGFGCALAFDFEFSLSMVCPFLALYLTPISRKEWIRITDCLSVSYYLAFVKIMTESLRDVPYAEGVIVGKYYGNFLNIITAGLFAAGAFVCALYWIARVTHSQADKKWKIIVSAVGVLSMIYPTVASVMFGSRISEISMIASVLACYVFLSQKKDKNIWIKRMGLMVVLLFLAIMGVIGGLRILRNYTEDQVNNISNEMIKSKFVVWYSAASRSETAKSRYEVFPDGSMLTVLDEAMSYRLTTSWAGIKCATWFGNGDTTVEIGTGSWVDAHNTYISWLDMYGWIGGIPVIIWFLAYVISSIKRVLKKDYVCLFSFLWGIYLMFEMIAGTVLWIFLAAFILLMMQYPLLVDQEESVDGNSLVRKKIENEDVLAEEETLPDEELWLSDEEMEELRELEEEFKDMDDLQILDEKDF